MSDCRSVPFDRQFCETGSLQAAFSADAQWIGLATEYVSSDQVANNRAKEVLSALNQHVFDGAECFRTLFQSDGRLRVNATSIDRCRNDIAAIGFLEPWDTKRGVEAAGKGENYW